MRVEEELDRFRIGDVVELTFCGRRVDIEGMRAGDRRNGRAGGVEVGFYVRGELVVAAEVGCHVGEDFVVDVQVVCKS